MTSRRRTPERSVESDEASVTSSRQLDFGGEGAQGTQHENEAQGGSEPIEETQQGSSSENQEGTDSAYEREPGEEESQNSSGEAPTVTADEDAESYEEAAGAPKRRRRKKVYWTSAEVDCLLDGVDKYGVGNWKVILEQGKDVFLAHRTNVDLKDKWKNIHMDRPGKQRREKLPDDIDVPDVSETNARGQPRRKAARVADQVMLMVAALERGRFDEELESKPRIHDGSTDRLSGLMKLKFAADDFYPELVEISVNLNTCRTVAALKQLILASIVPSASAYTEIQLVGLVSRCLLDDRDQLSQCISANGPEFFIMTEDNLEEFV